MKAVFLDRDGTIIELVNYIHKKEDVRLIPKSGVAIRKLNKKGYKVFISSNQSVVARGLITLKEAIGINNHLLNILEQRGAKIDGVYICPHHPEMHSGVPEFARKYRIPCDCRKPKPGMLLKAAKDFNINLNESWMVGDNTMDIETGKRAGCKTILVRTGYGGRDNLYKTTPDFTAERLYDATGIILNHS